MCMLKAMSSIGSITDLSHLDRKASIVDDLLCEIYDRWYDGRHDSFESDTFTECSSTSEVYHWRRNSFQLANDNKHSSRILPSVLQSQSKVLIINKLSLSLTLSPSLSLSLSRQLVIKITSLLKNNFESDNALN